MRNLALPAFAKIVEQTLGLEAHTRGLTSPGAAPVLAKGRGTRWVASLSFAPMNLANAFAFRAFLHQLRGQAGSFLLPILSAIGQNRASYTDLYNYTDGTTYGDLLATSGAASTAAAGATTITAALVVTVGTIVKIEDASGAQVVRVVSVSGTGPTYTLGIRPALRRAMTDPTVSTENVAIPLRLAEEAPAVAIVAGGRSAAISIACEEAY